MNIKKPFISLKNKIVSYTQEHPEDAAYYSGAVLTLIGCVIGVKIGDAINQKRVDKLWDEQEAVAIMDNGDDSFPVRKRDGSFGYVTPYVEEE